ncbi:MAG: MATE family efflux transporter [Abditibacteriota bacterium]|nr:MATE family efflux transporter [Abditibacteriota bacterium]
MKTGDSGMNMTEGSVPRLLLVFSMPMVLQMLFVVVNNFVSAVIVGQFVGAVALGVVAIVMPILFVTNSIAIGFTTATSILVAQAYGKGDLKGIRKIIDTSLILILVTCAAVMIAGIANIDALLRAIKAEESMMGDARIYLMVQFAITPLMFLQFLFFSSLRGIGDSKPTMWYQILGVTLTILFTLLLVCGFFGLPRLGIMGAALSMGIAQFIVDVCLLFQLVRTKSVVCPHLRNISFSKDLAWLTVRLGFPTMLQQVILNVCSIFIVGFVNRWGVIVTAGFGAASRIDFVAFAPAQAVCMAVSMMAGQNIGVQKFDRVKKIFGWGTLMAFVTTLVPAFFAWFYPEFLMRIFIHEEAPIAVGVMYLKYNAVAYLFYSFMFCGEGIPLAAGQTWVATVVSLISLWAFRVPLAWYFMNHGMEERGIWLGIVIGLVVGTVLITGYFFSGGWKRKALTPSEEEADAGRAV